MIDEGVNGRSLSEVARRLGVRPPSIYKYLPSLMALYDAQFERGQQAHLEAMRSAMVDAEPGFDALTKGLEGSERWALSNRALAQLLFWRPVPSCRPSDEAMAPSVEMVTLQRRALNDAGRNGELGPDADSDEALYLTSTLITGVLTQAFDEPMVVVHGAVEETGDHLVEEPDIVGAKHVGVDGDLLDRVDVGCCGADRVDHAPVISARTSTRQPNDQ